jgi:hypothetical protein
LVLVAVDSDEEDAIVVLCRGDVDVEFDLFLVWVVQTNLVAYLISAGPVATDEQLH